MLCDGDTQEDADQAAAIQRLSVLRSSLIQYTASMSAYGAALATHQVPTQPKPPRAGGALGLGGLRWFGTYD